MITYNFQAQFADAVGSGAKPFTLRRPRKPPARHAEVGELVALWTGLRRPGARRVGVGVCTLRALLRFDREGVRLVSDVRVATPALETTEALQQLLLNREGDALARLDGFQNWEEAWFWHVAHRTGAEKESWSDDNPSIVREAVAWSLLSEDQAAALASGRARLEDAA
jgi:hypothetical protein